MLSLKVELEHLSVTNGSRLIKEGVLIAWLSLEGHRAHTS